MAQNQKKRKKLNRNCNRNLTACEVERKIRSLKKSESLAFENIVNKELVRQIIESLHLETRDRIYTPRVTLLAFLEQAISDDGSCQEAVHKINARRGRAGLPLACVNTSSFCQARQRLPEELFLRLIEQTAKTVEKHERKPWLWNKRRVVLVDGLTTRGRDTPANQAEYPQPSSQKPGLGFPQVRHLAAFSLATGVVLDVQIGPVEGKRNGEISLLRKMMPKFRQGDVLLVDANFDSYVDMVNLQKQGVDIVVAIGGTRTSPFKGRCRCTEDKQVVFSRPKYNKDRFTREQWEALPKSFSVRMIRFRTTGRNKEITVITTLLDQKACPACSIAALYKHRWNCELDIRSLKTTMGMEELRCQSPEMLRREIYNYYLAYNIIRAAICDAARLSGRKPRELSFKNAIQTILAFGLLDQADVTRIKSAMRSIAANIVGDRPDRKEPRKVKRRKAKYSFLTKPRHVEKELLIA